METRRPKLLLADDSLTIQKVVTLTFTDEGLEVVSVGTGEEALRVMEESGPPDVLLADVHMPGMSGYEVCERVKRDERFGRVPVVLLKGAFEPFNEAEARRVGADEVLSKPFQSIRDLIGKVGSLLGGKEAAEESRGDERRDEPAADAHASSHATDARATMTGAAQGADAALAPQADSFATDFSMDDEMIEATPAESFGRREEAAHTGLAEAGAAFTGDAVAEARPVERREETAYAAAAGREAAESQAASPAFAPRASAVATADESLLDLGVADEPFPAPAEEDDFILDLDYDEPPTAAAVSAAAAPAADDSGESVPQVDTAGAFAEAAHGAGDTFGDALTASRAGYEFPDESAAHEGVSASQDVSAPSDESAPREFVEPQVVASDEPVRMGEDLSVEGDVVRAPVAAAATPAWDFSDAAVAHEEETATAEARTEPRESAEAPAAAAAALAPGQLSPEMIDAIARRAVELMSERAVQEIAWEVVPALAERIIRQRLDEQK